MNFNYALSHCLVIMKKLVVMKLSLCFFMENLQKHHFIRQHWRPPITCQLSSNAAGNQLANQYTAKILLVFFSASPHSDSSDDLFDWRCVHWLRDTMWSAGREPSCRRSSGWRNLWRPMSQTGSTKSSCNSVRILVRLCFHSSFPSDSVLNWEVNIFHHKNMINQAEKK